MGYVRSRRSRTTGNYIKVNYSNHERKLRGIELCVLKGGEKVETGGKMPWGLCRLIM